MYIRNKNLQDYLAERGVLPCYSNFYVKTGKLLHLLDCYQIQYYCIPNRL